MSSRLRRSTKDMYLVGALNQRVGLLRGAPPPPGALKPEGRRKLDSALRALGYVQ